MPERIRFLPSPSSAPRRAFSRQMLALGAVGVVASGCDPIINIYGSFFPAWLVCIVLGIVLAALLRWLFAVTRIEPHLGPLVLVYPALALLLSCVIWLVAFGP